MSTNCSDVRLQTLFEDDIAVAYELLTFAPGWSASAHHQDHDGLFEKKEHINFIEPHMWPPNSPDINPVDYAIGVLFSNESTANDNSRRWKN